MNKTIKLYASAVEENLISDHGFTPLHAAVKTSLQKKQPFSVRKLFLNGFTPVEAAKKISDTTKGETT